MKQSVKCKRTLCALELWTAVNGEEDRGLDDIRDLITYKDDLYTGYFVMVDKSEKVLKEFTEDAYKDFNKEYVVFGRETDYSKYKCRIPESIGIICMGNLYGMGNVILVVRKANEKR